MSLALLLVLLRVQDIPQGTLVAEVRSEARPVAGAEVRVADRTARTDRLGQARLSLPPGTWTVTVAAAGHHDATATVRIDAGAEARLEVELARVVASQEQVIVTASRTDRRLAQRRRAAFARSGRQGRHRTLLGYVARHTPGRSH